MPVLCWKSLVFKYQKCFMSLLGARKIGTFFQHIRVVQLTYRQCPNPVSMSHTPHTIVYTYKTHFCNCFPYRVAMLEFLVAAHSYLSTICQQCRDWVQSVGETTFRDQALDPGSIAEGVEGDGTSFTDLLGELFMSVQRVMVRHRKCVAITEENKGVVW